MRFIYEAAGFLDAELYLGIDSYECSLPNATLGGPHMQNKKVPLSLGL